MKLKFASIAIVALMAITSPAQAALTVYTNAGAFAAATTAPGVDTFTGFSITGTTPSPIVRTAGAYGYTGSVSTTTFFGAGTTANPWLSTNTATDTMTFNAFTGGAEAIAGNFFDSEVSGLFAAGDITIVATDSFGATSVQTIIGATVSSFLGFVSTGTITSLTVTSVQPAGTFLWPTLDNLTFAKVAVGQDAVPEPGTWLMMLAGFGFAGSAMRRRNAGRLAQAL